MNAGTKFFGDHPVVSAIMRSRTSVSLRKLRTVRWRAVLGRLAVMTFLLAMTAAAFPSPARGAWVNPTTGQFQVGGQLFQLALTNGGNPLCTSQKGGTSLALVQGFRAGL